MFFLGLVSLDSPNDLLHLLGCSRKVPALRTHQEIEAVLVPTAALAEERAGACLITEAEAVLALPRGTGLMLGLLRELRTEDLGDDQTPLAFGMVPDLHARLRDAMFRLCWGSDLAHLMTLCRHHARTESDGLSAATLN